MCKLQKVSVENLQYLSTSVEYSRSTRFLADFTIEMIGYEAGPVFNEWISDENQLTEIILQAHRDEGFLIGSLKTVFENLNLVKSYDYTNPNVFALSL